MKTSMSGVLWGEAYINGITAQDLEEVKQPSSDSEITDRRASDLLARGIARSARSRHNSEGFGE